MTAALYGGIHINCGHGGILQILTGPNKNQVHDQCSRSHLPGVVAKWNAEHPDDAIRVGDRIVKIGGDESLQGFALIEKLKEDGKFVACVMKCTKSMKNCESMPRSQGFPL